MPFALALPTETLLEEIGDRSMKQRDVAQTYALAMRDCADSTDWSAVNRAIIARWSRAGLERIKQLAHSGRCFHRAQGRGGGGGVKRKRPPDHPRYQGDVLVHL